MNYLTKRALLHCSEVLLAASIAEKETNDSDPDAGITQECIIFAAALIGISATQNFINVGAEIRPPTGHYEISFDIQPEDQTDMANSLRAAMHSLALYLAKHPPEHGSVQMVTKDHTHDVEVQR